MDEGELIIIPVYLKAEKLEGNDDNKSVVINEKSKKKRKRSTNKNQQESNAEQDEHEMNMINADQIKRQQQEFLNILLLPAVEKVRCQLSVLALQALQDFKLEVYEEQITVSV